MSLHRSQVSDVVSSWSVLDSSDVLDCEGGSQVYDPFNIQVCCVIFPGYLIATKTGGGKRQVQCELTINHGERLSSFAQNINNIDFL